MRILAIDVGTGTQDIMIYNTEKELENSIKLVLPSPHLFISQQIRELENDIYFEGEIMGGGKIKKSILEHMEKGYNVVMEPVCAKTIRDDLEQVKSYGIEIADESKDYSDYTKIKMGDINITKLSEFLLGYDLEFDFDKITGDDVKKIAKEYLKLYDEDDEKDVWFNKIKDVAEKCGYSREVKEYKQNPEKWPAHVGDVSTVLRVILTGRRNTPDLYEIMKVLGKEEVTKRIAKFE